MTGPQRIPRSTARYDPISHVVLEPYSVPGTLKPTESSSDAPKPPRPQNAWILYRAWALSDLLEKQPEMKGTPQSQLSKILGQQWANETPEVRKHFEHQANLSKERHAREFPNYVFRPQKKEEKERDREKRKEVKARARETEKMRKQIEKAMRTAQMQPPVMHMGVPAGLAPAPAVVQDVPLQNLGLMKFSELGPSPPLSQCPSPELPHATINDELSTEGTSPSHDGSNPSDSSRSTDDTSVTVSSESPSDVCPDDAELQAPATKWQQDNTMALDASHASDSSTGDAFDWAQVASGSMTDIDTFINHAFRPGVPGPASERFEMPSGNIMVSPGLVENGMDSNNFEASGLVRFPLGDKDGLLDDQYDCDLVNPHSEESTSSGNKPDSDHANEAIFMQPFVQLDVSLKHLLPAGAEVGEALLDEQGVCMNGERVIAAEHVQDGAPAVSVEKPDVSSFLPSPPESSSSAVSPFALGTFDFGSATNLSASSSNQQAFCGLGLSDAMSTSSMDPSVWGMPSFSDFPVHDAFGLESSNELSTITTQFPTSVDEFSSDLRSGLFSSVPPTPISAGSWFGGSFEIGEITMADFPTTNFAPPSDETQAQKEDAWLTSS